MDRTMSMWLLPGDPITVLLRRITLSLVGLTCLLGLIGLVMMLRGW
ncbi:MAG TPA: hypothetical protein VGB18_01840 [Candidatus Thermoplasmatota archaeon]